MTSLISLDRGVHLSELSRHPGIDIGHTFACLGFSSAGHELPVKSVVVREDSQAILIALAFGGAAFALDVADDDKDWLHQRRTRLAIQTIMCAFRRPPQAHDFAARRSADDIFSLLSRLLDPGVGGTYRIQTVEDGLRASFESDFGGTKVVTVGRTDYAPLLLEGTGKR